MGGLFFYTIGIAFLTGIFIRSFFDIGNAHIILMLLISFVGACVWRMRSGVYRSPLFVMSLAFLCIALGVLRLDVADTNTSAFDSYAHTATTLTGTVVREPDYRTTTVHLYVHLSEYDELILVTTDRYQTFHYGDVVSVQGELVEPEPFETDLGRIFDYRGYLKARGVSYMMPFATVHVLREGEGNPLLGMLLHMKAAFMTSIESIIPEPQVGLGEGVLLGVKRALGEELEQVFRQTGIIHIVVLSGYNVMLVAEAIMRLLSFFFLPRTRLIVGVLGIATFALLVGLSATVVRASLMAVLVLIARTMGRTYTILRALLLAGIVMVVLNPYLLAYDPGFQLSFLATMGLIFLAPLLEARCGLVPTTFGVREFLTATIATQIFVLPLLMYQIGEVSLVAVVVNVLVLPMVPVAMLLTFFSGIGGLVLTQIGILFGYVAYLSLSYIIVIATFFAHTPFASVTVPAFPFWIVIALYMLMGHVLYRFSVYERTSLDVPDVVLEDSYADWTIKEVKDEPAPSSSGGKSAGSNIDTFPFR